MGKTRDLFKKIRDTEGIFHAKMGTIKDINGMGLTEAEEIKKRWQAQHSENEDHGIWSHHFMGNRWGNGGNSVRLYFGGLQNHCRW